MDDGFHSLIVLRMCYIRDSIPKVYYERFMLTSLQSCSLDSLLWIGIFCGSDWTFFSRSKLIEVSAVQPNIANFGRSLLGGYCSSYVPDFVLQGISSDERLRQCLLSDLSHAVQVSDHHCSWIYLEWSLNQWNPESPYIFVTLHCVIQ